MAELGTPMEHKPLTILEESEEVSIERGFLMSDEGTGFLGYYFLHCKVIKKPIVISIKIVKGEFHVKYVHESTKQYTDIIGTDPRLRMIICHSDGRRTVTNIQEDENNYKDIRHQYPRMKRLFFDKVNELTMTYKPQQELSKYKVILKYDAGGLCH